MKCENCGNEHNGSYGSGRFCSVKCSRGFSTKAKRKEINEKISKSLYKENIFYCISCGEERKSKNSKYCVDCGNFWKYKKLFKKLNINESNIKIANKKAIDLLKKEYYDNNLSFTMIRDKYDIQLNTIHFYFSKNGVNIKSNAQAGRDAWKLNRLNPPMINSFKNGYHISWDNKKIYYRSSYELEYAKLLDSYKIEYDVEFKRIEYFDSIKKVNRMAIPDFYLPKSNTIIEIKSSYTFDIQNMKDKFKEYENQGYNTKLILDHKEIKI